jgi:hypothetical protein
MNINITRVLILGLAAITVPTLSCELSQMQVGLNFLYVIFGVVAVGGTANLTWKHTSLNVRLGKYLQRLRYAPEYQRSKIV